MSQFLDRLMFFRKNVETFSEASRSIEEASSVSSGSPTWASAARRTSQRTGHGSTRKEKLGPQMALGIDVRRRLEVLARELGVDAPAFSQQLLERALAEALSCLDPSARERVRFEGGAP